MSRRCQAFCAVILGNSKTKHSSDNRLLHKKTHTEKKKKGKESCGLGVWWLRKVFGASCCVSAEKPQWNCIALVFDSAILNFQDLLFWALKQSHLPVLSGTPNNRPHLYCKYQAKGSADKRLLADTASAVVISTSDSRLSVLHFVRLLYLSAGSPGHSWHTSSTT